MPTKKGPNGSVRKFDESNGRYVAENGQQTNNDHRGTKQTVETSKLAVDTPEARQLCESIANEERYTYEQLMSHPTVQEFEKQKRRGEIAKKNKKPITEAEAQQCAAEFLKNASSTPREFRADIVMGLPSAGKSTAVVNELKKKYGSFEFDNDEIKKLLPGYDEYGASYVHDDSKTVQTTAFQHFAKDGQLNGTNLALPIVGSETSSVVKWIGRLQNAGYTVHVHHVGISNQESLNRSTKRAIETGRYVPLGIIRDYGDKPAKVFNELKKIKKEGVIYEQ